MRAIGIDTETSYVQDIGMHMPFLAQTCDEQLRTQVYEVRTVGNYKKNQKQFEVIRKVVESDKILKVFHNAPYDIAMFHTIGIHVVPPFADTLNAAGLLNENFSPKGLKPLARNYLNDPCEEEIILSKIKTKTTRELRKSGILGKDEELPWHWLPRKELFAYAAKDPLLTLKLWYLFKKPLRRYKKCFDFEMSLIPVTTNLYLNGLKIDRPFVKHTIDEYEKKQAQVLSNIQRMVKSYKVTFETSKEYKRYPKKIEAWDRIEKLKSGTFFAVKNNPYNPNSSAHKSKVLAHLEVPVPETANGQLSSDQKILEPFRQQYPFVQATADYGWYEKQLSTYYKPFWFWHTNNKNDIAHFSYYQSAAKSGRYTAERIHQIPRMDEELEDPRIIRNAFSAPKNGWIVTNDYDQIEMRLFAHYTKSKLLINDFLEGRDPYTQVAVNVGRRIDIDVDAMDKANKKAWRRKGKQCCLGVIYGMGKEKTATSLKLPMMQSFEFLNYFYELYPVQEFMQKTISDLYKKGCITVRYNSKLMDFYRDFRVPQELAYKGVNIIMQGTAGFVMKAGMKRCYDVILKDKALKKVMTVPWTGLPAIHGTIHDELIFYVFDKKRSVAEECTAQMQSLMDDKVTFRVPITTSPKISDRSWGEAKPL